jgi:dTDP-4-dehydrorhamnose 3,5-epimerase
MHFQPTSLEGVRLIEIEPIGDDRGSFARTFCTREFAANGLTASFVQHSISSTVRVGSIRGMHFQHAPHEETKLIRCLKGGIYDVLVDLRPSSPTYMQWEAYELTNTNWRELYVPAGIAHGFQTLQPDTEVSYAISAFYDPEAASGVRYDDPAFAITWPLPVADLSDRDRAWPAYVKAVPH